MLEDRERQRWVKEWEKEWEKEYKKITKYATLYGDIEEEEDLRKIMLAFFTRVYCHWVDVSSGNMWAPLADVSVLPKFANITQPIIQWNVATIKYSNGL